MVTPSTRVITTQVGFLSNWSTLVIILEPTSYVRVPSFSETTAEVGTIAGIASAVAMALLGAVTSYISYQKKKLCFSIQRKDVNVLNILVIISSS